MRIQCILKLGGTDQVAEIGDYTNFKGIGKIQRKFWNSKKECIEEGHTQKRLSISVWTKSEDGNVEKLIGFDNELGYFILYLPSSNDSYIESIDIDHFREIINNRMNCYVLSERYNDKIVLGIQQEEIPIKQ